MTNDINYDNSSELQVMCILHFFHTTQMITHNAGILNVIISEISFEIIHNF